MKDRNDRDELIEAIKEMAKRCYLENWEQIADNGSAIGAVRMIQEEYLLIVAVASRLTSQR